MFYRQKLGWGQLMNDNENVISKGNFIIWNELDAVTRVSELLPAENFTF